VRHTTALDAGKFETVVGCFSTNGSPVSPRGHTGEPALREFAHRLAGFPSAMRNCHMIVNPPSARAQATCYPLVPLVDTADRIVDLGPEGSDAGSGIVAEATLWHSVQIDGIYTGKFLRDLLLRASGRSIPRAAQTPIQ
jgi:hypothetical protein